MKADLLFSVDQNLLDAESALQRATGDDIIQLCRDYLLLLSKYRDQLYELRGTPEICLQQISTAARELVEQTRRAIRTSLEITTKERNEVETLLKSFTSINGYEAAKTFNRLNYQGFDNWESSAGGLRLKSESGDKRMSIQEAVETAGRLRREAYIAHKIIF